LLDYRKFFHPHVKSSHQFAPKFFTRRLGPSAAKSEARNKFKTFGFRNSI
jgi:hypothetical protein